MDIVAIIAENRIKEAVREGEFDNLRGSGKPLVLDDLSHVPPELRASYIVLKNAGILPEEVHLQKEIVRLQDLIDYCYDEEEKKRMKRKLNEKLLRFNMLMEKRNKTSESVLRNYEDKIYQKLGSEKG